MFPIVFAETNNTSLSEEEKVDLIRSCLGNKTEEKGCSNLALEEKIFSLLSIGECRDELISDMSSSNCWPSSGCKIKETAQAILALERTGENTTNAEQWLLSQNTTPTDIIWYLQIESSEATNCTISYSESEYSIKISADKKVSSGAGNCLSLSDGSWWLKVASSCYGKEIEVSCDKKFLTNLLFQKEGSSTIHVSEKTTESSANGLNNEMVNSFCFKQNGACNYEGSLWAAMILDYTGNDVDPYMPYLITLSENENNEKYLPESFLYYLTNSDDFRKNLLLKQKVSKYWEESGDRFYDTAIALLPFSDEPPEKVKSKNWLLDEDTLDSEGCWKGSISATGLLLFSLWPTEYDDDKDNDGYSRGEDCNDSNYLIHPNATEYCDELDNDCDEEVDENCTESPDYDEDGYPSDVDCDDRNYLIHPGAIEYCDEEDNDCDEEIDEDCINFTDEDEDGYPIEVDCNDTNRLIHPGATEYCDEIDNNCNNQTDDDCINITQDEDYCEDNDGFCISRAACSDAGGDELEFICTEGLDLCCSEEEELESCFNQEGEICYSNQNCVGGREVDAPELQTGQKCCIEGGICEDIEEENSACYLAGGTCKFSCNDDEEVITEECEYSSYDCCKENSSIDPKPKSKRIWIWILILFILIVLVAIAYFYKDKIRAYWIAHSGGRKSSSSSKGGPFLPPSSPSFFRRGISSRRIVPVPSSTPNRHTLVRKPSGEMEEVLKKLKDMGK